MTASIGSRGNPTHTRHTYKCHQDRKPNWIMSETAKLNLRSINCDTHSHAVWWMFGMANRGVCLRPLGETTKGITAHWHLKSALSEIISRAHCDGVYYYYFHGRLCSRLVVRGNMMQQQPNHFSHNAADIYISNRCAHYYFNLRTAAPVCSSECCMSKRLRCHLNNELAAG